MEEVKTGDDTIKPTFSGVQWFTSPLIIFLVALFIDGAKKKRVNR